MAAFLFCCNDETEKECFDRALFGGPEGMKHTENIEEGTPLFLYNVDSKELSGTSRNALKNV